MPSVKFKGDTSVCVGDSTIIYALDNKGFPGYGYNYLWSTGSTADSIVVKGITPGLYTYYLTVTKGGCSKDSSEIKVRVHYCVGGVKTYFNPLDVGIFPNPATNQLSITTDNPFGSNAVLTISDVTGRIVQKETITANQSKFNTDISSLAPSIYFLKIQTDRGIAVKKFVKD